MLINRHLPLFYEAGLDESGAGCFAGSVVAAAVILPPDFYHPDLNDSKKMTEKKRDNLYDIILKESIAYSIQEVDNKTIDEINILQARFLAMDKAIKDISVKPKHLIIDGNRFYKEYDISFDCIVKGDAKFTSIAAASVLAKVYRDEMMRRLHDEFPQYGWNTNMSYGTTHHIAAIKEHGICKYHRLSFLKKITY